MEHLPALSVEEVEGRREAVDRRYPPRQGVRYHLADGGRWGHVEVDERLFVVEPGQHLDLIRSPFQESELGALAAGQEDVAGPIVHGDRLELPPRLDRHGGSLAGKDYMEALRADEEDRPRPSADGEGLRFQVLQRPSAQGYVRDGTRFALYEGDRGAERVCDDEPSTWGVHRHQQRPRPVYIETCAREDIDTHRGYPRGGPR